ncbi:MAG: sensor histidine kinase [Bacteroidales bacterium]|nr:sensor histidine kinase [Bacteroidales bacterium]
MLLITWYHRHIKEKLFNRIILMYSINSVISEDICYFLKHDYIPYLHYRLDSYYSSPFTTRKNIETYLTSCLNQEKDIESIALYSYLHQSIYGLRRSNSSLYYKKCPHIERRFSVKNAPLLMEEKQKRLLDRPNVYTFAFEIKDPSSLQALGMLSVEYDVDGIRKTYEERYTKTGGKILILTEEGGVIFDSFEEDQEKVYPYFQQLKEGPHEITLDQEKYLVHVLQSSNTGAFIVGLISKAKIVERTDWMRNTIWGVCFILIIGAIMMSYFSIVSFSHRTQQIKEAMSELRQGDLSIRIPISSEEDELTAIADNFNKMCEDLNDYIDKVYLAEIQQKQAELIALQAQINPHFLYNTLEVIRMRAIAQGADDVGQMIYILSTLFKHSIKDEMIISVSEEVEHCKLYLELFQIRYKNRLKVHIDVPQELLSYGIVKLSLQPIIENYIIHGIRLEDSDNMITLKGEEDNGKIVFVIVDNGQGIPPHILDKVQYNLKTSVQYSENIGLSNVNQRLKKVYGEEYGLFIESQFRQGTKVIVKIKAERKGDLIKNVQSISSR